MPPKKASAETRERAPARIHVSVKPKASSFRAAKKKDGSWSFKLHGPVVWLGVPGAFLVLMPMFYPESALGVSILLGAGAGAGLAFTVWKVLRGEAREAVERANSFRGGKRKDGSTWFDIQGPVAWVGVSAAILLLFWMFYPLVAWGIPVGFGSVLAVVGGFVGYRWYAQRQASESA